MRMPVCVFCCLVLELCSLCRMQTPFCLHVCTFQRCVCTDWPGVCRDAVQKRRCHLRMVGIIPQVTDVAVIALLLCGG